MAFGILYGLLGAVGIGILSSLKIVNEYERGVKFTLGKYAGVIDPGLRLVVPVIQSWKRVDLRVKVVDVPEQDCITKDNVSLKVNAVLYYKVSHPDKAILQVEYYNYAVSQLAQTTMRDVVGEVELDDVLSKRETISARIQNLVDKASDTWGIKVTAVELKHIELPPDLKRVIGKQAEAMRERRAVIINAEGEKIAAKNLADAARTLSAVPGALHLRTLNTLNDVSSDQSNTIVFCMPLEVLRALEGLEIKRKKE